MPGRLDAWTSGCLDVWMDNSLLDLSGLAILSLSYPPLLTSGVMLGLFYDDHTYAPKFTYYKRQLITLCKVQ